MQVYQVTTAVSPDKLAALGHLSIHFAILEFRVEQAIWAIRGDTRKLGRQTTSRMMLSRRLKVLRGEAKQRLDQPSKAFQFFDSLIGAIEPVAKLRNILIHGVWAHDGKDRTRNVVISYFDNTKGVGYGASAKEIHNLTANVLTLIHSVERGIKKHLGVSLP